MECNKATAECSIFFYFLLKYEIFKYSLFYVEVESVDHCMTQFPELERFRAMSTTLHL